MSSVSTHPSSSSTPSPLSAKQKRQAMLLLATFLSYTESHKPDYPPNWYELSIERWLELTAHLNTTTKRGVNAGQPRKIFGAKVTMQRYIDHLIRLGHLERAQLGLRELNQTYSYRLV